MVTIIEVIGLIGFVAGIVSFFIAIYSLIGQKKLEKRFRKKEELRAISREVEPLISSIRSIVGEVKDPNSNIDQYMQLRDLSREIVSKAFDGKKDICDILIEIWIPTNPRIPIEKIEDMNKALEEAQNINISAELGEGSYFLSENYVYYTPIVLEGIDILEKEFGNQIKEFNPTILESLKDCIKEMLMMTIDSAIQSKNLKINIKEFNNTDDLGLWIYDKAIGRNKLGDSLIKLELLKTELERLREIFVTTSYT